MLVLNIGAGKEPLKIYFYVCFFSIDGARYPAPIAFCGISPHSHQGSKKRSELKPEIIGSETKAE